MKIDKITLHCIKLNMRIPLEISYGVFADREIILACVTTTDGVCGYGESVAYPGIMSGMETNLTNVAVMEELLIPMLFAAGDIEHPDQVSERIFAPLDGNPRAKATLENAVWDAYCKTNGISVSRALGGTQKKIACGVSVGIKPSIDALMEALAVDMPLGFQRIKLKVKHGWDIDVIRRVREAYPDMIITVDANGAYEPKDLEHLRQFDQFDLAMIEQPYKGCYLAEMAELQKQLNTPICLDESIESFYDCKRAVDMGSCRIINIKQGRNGGLTESRKIHDYCQQHGVALWCGGMLECGVGIGAQLAIASLPGFTLPADIFSSYYWFGNDDVIEPFIYMDEQGYIKVEDDVPGIGSFTLDQQRFWRAHQWSKSYTAK
ncbi:MAG: o-succinylbenzoate synthase [Bacillota bacterium]|nr:o-succinylbenzoate synthase [Bacillota bacterium]